MMNIDGNPEHAFEMSQGFINEEGSYSAVNNYYGSESINFHIDRTLHGPSVLQVFTTKGELIKEIRVKQGCSVVPRDLMSGQKSGLYLFRVNLKTFKLFF
jgi:hypothetical protein